mmetsp:Transcript_1926/g.3055  ORF Transcript_1926/g.3055 Transcript_1926/m.3055 type:complete len:216 (-) Transcript_1926:1785-2432(-)
MSSHLPYHVLALSWRIPQRVTKMHHLILLHQEVGAQLEANGSQQSIIRYSMQQGNFGYGLQQQQLLEIQIGRLIERLKHSYHSDSSVRRVKVHPAHPMLLKQVKRGHVVHQISSSAEVELCYQIYQTFLTVREILIPTQSTGARASQRPLLEEICIYASARPHDAEKQMRSCTPAMSDVSLHMAQGHLLKPAVVWSSPHRYPQQLPLVCPDKEMH